MRTIGLLLALAFNASLFAQPVSIVGTIEHKIKVPANNTLNTHSSAQSIKFLKVTLSDSARRVLQKRTQATMSNPNVLLGSPSLPSSFALGMGNVPVLNQGHFGSCVTFATTAAIDAALNQGDYISQLCQLQLGLNLEKNGFMDSGWNGTYGRAALTQIENFGIVSKTHQRSVGCGGLTEYPDEIQPTASDAMSLENFHEISEDLAKENIVWSPILDMFNAVLDRTDTNKTINEIKATLNKKERVTFGVLLVDLDLGVAGAVGSRNAPFDSWVLTPEIARDIYLHPEFGGHEMIITGYDDNAVAIDDKGIAHKGLFTLRNSWGDKLGDKGDFYMSYDYFKVLVIEAYRIRHLGDEDSDK